MLDRMGGRSMSEHVGEGGRSMLDRMGGMSGRMTSTFGHPAVQSITCTLHTDYGPHVVLGVMASETWFIVRI